MKFQDLFDNQEALRFKRKLMFKQQAGLIPNAPGGLGAWLPFHPLVQNQMKFKPSLDRLPTWQAYIKQNFVKGKSNV